MNSGCIACGFQLIPLSGSAQRETVKGYETLNKSQELRKKENKFIKTGKVQKNLESTTDKARRVCKHCLTVVN